MAYKLLRNIPVLSPPTPTRQTNYKNSMHSRLKKNLFKEEDKEIRQRMDRQMVHNTLTIKRVTYEIQELK